MHTDPAGPRPSCACILATHLLTRGFQKRLRALGEAVSDDEDDDDEGEGSDEEEGDANGVD